jgi:hypothetical protein
MKLWISLTVCSVVVGCGGTNGSTSSQNSLTSDSGISDQMVDGGSDGGLKVVSLHDSGKDSSEAGKVKLDAATDVLMISDSHVSQEAGKMMEAGVDAQTDARVDVSVPPPPPPPAPTCIDGLKNGNETDVDCGGRDCPACAVDASCKVMSDCVSQACNYLGTCVATKSCISYHGGYSCGVGEDLGGENPTQQESCCVSLPIAGTPYVVDKYLMTAGRIRAMVNALGGDIQNFTQNIPATNTWWDHNWDQFMPKNTAEVDAQLGPYPAPLTPDPYMDNDDTMDMVDDIPDSYLGQWRLGCQLGKPNFSSGMRTWWINYMLPGDGAPPIYSQDYLDEKPINCIDAMLGTAACIWDGGHLWTQDEMAAAWGDGDFPWSFAYPDVSIDYNSQMPQGTAVVNGMVVNATYFLAHEFGNDNQEFMTPFTYTYDPFGLASPDMSIHIAPPGRFPLGNSVNGHADLAGDVYTFTAIQSGTHPNSLNFMPTQLKDTDYVGTTGGEATWEIHPLIAGSGTEQKFPVFRGAAWAYWAASIRCAK